MMAQIDRLSPTDRRVLRSAAVIGTSFAKDLVDAALAPDAPAPDTWQRLSEFLMEDETGTSASATPSSATPPTRASLPAAPRESTAGSARRSRRARPDRAEDEAELLSLHFFHAHDFDKAWRYSRVAGDHAQSIYANSEAQQFFERASRRHVICGRSSRTA